MPPIWTFNFHSPAEFELDGVRSKLDEEGLGIASHQEASVRQRRLLADATKGKNVLEKQ